MVPEMRVITDLDFERGIVDLPPKEVAAWGFRVGERGTHTSRTIMLQELSHMLDAAPGDASRGDYQSAVLDDNCLGKRTTATRKLSFHRLSELYGLDRRLILFRGLRELWGQQEDSRPLLGLMLALARDPLLRATAPTVLSTPFGHELARQPMKNGLSMVAGARLNPDTLDKVVRNASSSWTQSGHLRGRSRKTRQRVRVTPAAVAYALLLGFGTGSRGRLLFETPWCSILDAATGELLELAVVARRLGLLDFKQSGSIIEVSFAAVLAGPRSGASDGAYRQTG